MSQTVRRTHYPPRSPSETSDASGRLDPNVEDLNPFVDPYGPVVVGELPAHPAGRPATNGEDLDPFVDPYGPVVVSSPLGVQAA